MTTAGILMLIGRVIFGGFFVIAAVRNTLGFGKRIGSPTNYGWPLPTALLALGFAMQLVGGVSLILDVWTVAGALILILFLVLATSLFHNPLLFKAPERDLHLYLTLVNITLAGGLLLIIADALQRGR